jgi:hypothetical protein
VTSEARAGPGWSDQEVASRVGLASFEAEARLLSRFPACPTLRIRAPSRSRSSPFHPQNLAADRGCGCLGDFCRFHPLLLGGRRALLRPRRRDVATVGGIADGYGSIPSLRSSTIAALRQRVVSGENGSVSACRLPCGAAFRRAEHGSGRRRLDGQPRGFKPADELTHVLPHLAPRQACRERYALRRACRTRRGPESSAGACVPIRPRAVARVSLGRKDRPGSPTPLERRRESVNAV